MDVFCASEKSRKVWQGHVRHQVQGGRGCLPPPEAHWPGRRGQGPRLEEAEAGLYQRSDWWWRSEEDDGGAEGGRCRPSGTGRCPESAGRACPVVLQPSGGLPI